MTINSVIMVSGVGKLFSACPFFHFFHSIISINFFHIRPGGNLAGPGRGSSPPSPPGEQVNDNHENRSTDDRP